MFGVVMGGTALVSVFVGLAASMGAPFLILPAVLAGLGGAAVAVWLAVRLSLVAPMTFAEQKIAIKESWAMTKGRFWPLLGMAVLAGVMSMLVGLLGSIVIAPLNLIFGGLESLAGAETTNIATLLVKFWPALLVWGVVNALLSAAQAAIILDEARAAASPSLHRPGLSFSGPDVARALADALGRWAVAATARAPDFGAPIPACPDEPDEWGSRH